MAIARRRRLGGEQVVKAGRVLTVDMEAAALRVRDAQVRTEADVPSRDHTGRTAEKSAPLALLMG